MECLVIDEEIQKHVKEEFSLNELTNESYLPLPMEITLRLVPRGIRKDKCYDAATVIEANVKCMATAPVPEEEQPQTSDDDDFQSPVVNAWGGSPGVV